MPCLGLNSRSVQYVSSLLCLNIPGWSIILSVTVCNLVFQSQGADPKWWRPTCDNFPIENLYLLFVVLPTVHVVLSKIETVPIGNWWTTTQLLKMLISRTFYTKVFVNCLQDVIALIGSWQRPRNQFNTTMSLYNFTETVLKHILYSVCMCECVDSCYILLLLLSTYILLIITSD